jgi:tetratricopeptide (TPR) repeat protein
VNINYKEILNLKNFDDFKPEEVVNILGIIFETGRENKSEKDVVFGLNLSEKQNFEGFSDENKMIFHFNVANGWSYLQQLSENIKSEEFWSFDLKEYEKQVIHLRLALSFLEKSVNNYKKCEILTNLGIIFSHLGRFSEAQLYWQQAIKIDSSFSMAIGNIGYSLVHYSKILYDNGHQILFLKFAYQYLNKAIDSDIYEEAKIAFKNTITFLESIIEIDELKNIQNLENFSIGSTKEEQEYRTWCLQKNLFLNPLNDIIVDNIAGHDCLFLPTITLEFNKPPIYQTIFNQIKQEFVFARHILFEGLTHKNTHYSDKDNIQLDTLDYAVYSHSSEKIKTAFRICYSILDKIGYLINDYLNLDYKPHEVSFRSIWTLHDKKTQKLKINNKIIETQNWAFRGLYWLSKDLYEKNEEFSFSIEPDAKKLAQIRNFIEHKSFKIIEFGEEGLFDNGLTYVITREEFEKKTLKLITLIRASMIYLSLGINLEEKKKIISLPTLPIDFIELRDELKR